MRRTCCHTFLAFLLKFLNFFQIFIGVSIIVYSAYMLNHWNHSIPPPSPAAPSPAAIPGSTFDAARVSIVAGGTIIDMLDSNSLPAPWFIYAFMGLGVVLCCITCIGHIAAEAIHGCCLCFYSLLKTILILLEVGCVAFIALDHHWEKDLPVDPTGELDNLRSFIEENIDVCKWIGVAVIVIQVLSLLLAIVLRSMVSVKDYDIEEDGDDRGRMREPLLNSQPSQISGSSSSDGKVFHSDIWSSRMREKYGLSGGDKHNLSNQTA